jgi:hypothetical protein
MTLTTVAGQDGASDSPRIKVTLASTLGGSEWVTITRTHEDGESFRVITDRNARLSGGAWVGYDYHAPFGQMVSYTATTANETSAATPAVLLSDVTWLIHATDPTLSVPVEYLPEDALGDDNLGGSAGLFTIRGSDRPATVWDDTMVITSTVRAGFLPEQMPALYKLLRSGGPVLLNIPAGLDVDWRWIAPSAKIGRNLGKTAAGGAAGYPYRMLDIGYTWVRQPEIDLTPEWSYNTLEAAFPTLNALEAAYATLDAIITDTRI